MHHFQVPLQNFVGEAFVVNVKEQVAKNRDYAVTVADLEDYEAKNGQIEQGAILIINTGYGIHWPNKTAYLGSNVPKDASHLHFPGKSAIWHVMISRPTKLRSRSISRSC